MTIEILKKEMIAALKSGNKARKNVISGLIAAIKKEAIDTGARDNITEALVDKVILKEKKSAEDQLNTCPKDRVELIAEYTYNLEVINEYAPKLLSENEIAEILDTQFAEVLASKNKGMIMKTIMPFFKGKADGKLVNRLIGERL